MIATESEAKAIQPSEANALFNIIGQNLAVFWGGYRTTMEAVTAGPSTSGRFVLRGKCPHCGERSVFIQPTGVSGYYFTDGETFLDYGWQMMECSGCRRMILALAFRPPEGGWAYDKHYPVGLPPIEIDEAVPEHISKDFKEALKCRNVGAFNATVEMCRRALEGSCIEKGANPSLSTEKKIDFLASKHAITQGLADMAHTIRLAGNRGAHAADSPDEDEPLNEDEADAVIEFTRQFFDHIYVFPARRAKYDFSRQRGRKQS